MGFFTRTRAAQGSRAVHPDRAVKRAVTPKPIKKAQRALHPIDNAIYSLERSLNTKPRPSRRSASSASQGLWLILSTAISIVLRFELDPDESVQQRGSTSEHQDP